MPIMPSSETEQFNSQGINMGLWTRARGSSLLRSLCGICARVMCCVYVCVSIRAGPEAQWSSAGVVSCCQNVGKIYNPFKFHIGMPVPP